MPNQFTLPIRVNTPIRVALPVTNLPIRPILPIWGARMACWLEHRTRDRKIASSNPGWSGGRIFSSRVNFVCWLLFGVRSTPVLPQWHVKDPGHSAKSAGVRFYTLTCKHLWPQKVGVGWQCRCPGIVWEAIRKRAHMQLVGEHSVTVVSARWATVD